MDSKRIALPPDLISRCWHYGEQVVADYANGLNANSRAVSCFDAESNVDLQALARMAECVFCINADISPDVLNWGRHCDSGSDVHVNGLRIDVKHTKYGRYLIWPIAKNEIFSSKKFDALALVVGTPFENFEVAGWISKADFAGSKKVAAEGGKLFPGTWYMDRSDLRPIETLFAPYDGTDDFVKSRELGFKLIRERVANGGPGWDPK